MHFDVPVGLRVEKKQSEFVDSQLKQIFAQNHYFRRFTSDVCLMVDFSTDLQ